MFYIERKIRARNIVLYYVTFLTLMLIMQWMKTNNIFQDIAGGIQIGSLKYNQIILAFKTFNVVFSQPGEIFDNNCASIIVVVKKFSATRNVILGGEN